MVKLKRLKISKFRHVEPTELFFDDRYNVPLGINGSGKTTLLKLISACLRSDFSEYKEEVLGVEYELWAGEGRFIVSVSSRRGDPMPPIGLPTLDASPSLALGELGRSPPVEFSVTISFSFTSGPTFIAKATHGHIAVSIDGQQDAHEAAGVTLTDGPFFVRILFTAISLLESSWIDLRPQTPWGNLLGIRASYRFDESLELLQEITLRGSLASGFPVAVRMVFVIPHGDSSASLSSTGPFFPKGFLVTHRQADEVKKASTVTFTSEDAVLGFEAGLAKPRSNFLASFARVAGFAKVELVLRVLQSEATDEEEKFSLGLAAFRFHGKSGGSISHELLSYGQKRLLSFFYYVACNDEAIVADELVNGLHHAWIEACLDAIGERQAFLTSQNPILLDFIPPASPEEAQRRFIRCVPKEGEGRDVITWRNLTHEEAEELCANYAAGVQQLSDLLRIQGLW